MLVANFISLISSPVVDVKKKMSIRGRNIAHSASLDETVEMRLDLSCVCLFIFLWQFVSLERKLLELKPAGTRFERWTGIHPFDRKVLYKGIWLRMARCGIGSFLVVRCYFFAVDQLVSRGNMLT